MMRLTSVGFSMGTAISSMTKSPLGRLEAATVVAGRRGRVDRLGGHRQILQLEPCAGAAEHEAASAHVATANEGDRKTQAVGENGKEHLGVLAGGDAAEQDRLSIGAKAFGQCLRIS